ncbi:hypothetical protein HMSSN139_47440 [Paenibacillus sp. HMSSN-139]|nr:hypothetical protein HMSSN139_47440 [Paenibacillus sp. HMSSN-139]
MIKKTSLPADVDFAANIGDSLIIGIHFDQAENPVRIPDAAQPFDDGEHFRLIVFDELLVVRRNKDRLLRGHRFLVPAVLGKILLGIDGERETSAEVDLVGQYKYP